MDEPSRWSRYDDEGYGGYGGYGFRPYVPVHQRRLNAQKKLPKLLGKGKTPAPVQGSGKTIAASFWGQSWCRNLERYSDYENRLPRGRTYVRNGSVVHLDVLPGEVHAYVSGSELYSVKVKITPLPAARWKALVADCVGSIASLVELLQGQLDAQVMERVCREASGLFPSPGEIDLDCSCPDYAGMCKHVAAVLYGVGVRLDADPEVLFRLRKVSAAELVAGAGKGLARPKKGPAADQILAEGDVAAVFGVEFGEGSAPAEAAPPTAQRSAKPEAGVPTGAKPRTTAKKSAAAARAASAAKAARKATPSPTPAVAAPGKSAAKKRATGKKGSGKAGGGGGRTGAS